MYVYGYKFDTSLGLYETRGKEGDEMRLFLPFRVSFVSFLFWRPLSKIRSMTNQDQELTPLMSTSVVSLSVIGPTSSYSSLASWHLLVQGHVPCEVAHDRLICFFFFFNVHNSICNPCRRSCITFPIRSSFCFFITFVDIKQFVQHSRETQFQLLLSRLISDEMTQRQINR